MGLTIGLCIAGAILLCFFLLYVTIRNKIRAVSREAFGTSDLIEGIKREELEVEQTPRSLSSMESMASPRIAADFPELNITGMKSRAGADIIAFLNAVEMKDTTAFAQRRNVSSLIAAQIEDSKDQQVSFDNIEIHEIVLNRYIKTADNAILRFQSAVGYTYKKGEEQGRQIQDRFELDYIYMLDETKLIDGVYTFLKCPNCGAPVKTLGKKCCEYCGTEIVAAIEKIWRLDSLKRT